MKHQNYTQVASFCAFFTLFSACKMASNTQNQPPFIGAIPQSSATAPVMPEGWTTEEEANGAWASRSVTRMTASEREKVRNEVSSKAIEWLNSKSGYSLYKIMGSEKFDSNAFIMPKIFVIGSVDGGRAALRDLPSGQVALTIPMALIDGSQSELTYSTTRVRVPDALVLNDSKREQIQQELTDAFGHRHELLSMGSCPKKISILVAGEEYDVTPRVFGGPNGPSGCQANQPLTVTLTGTRRFMQRFLRDDVFNGSVEVAVKYEIAGAYVDEIRTYVVKTDSLLDELKKSVAVSASPAPTGDAESTKTVRTLSGDQVDGLLSPMVARALSKWQTSERNLERVKSSVIAQLKWLFFDEGNANSARTYTLKSDSLVKAVDIPVRTVNESLGREGETFYSSSIIKPILGSNNVAIRGESRANLALAPQNGVSQDVFMVRQGEEYELQLTSLVVHEYEFGDEQSTPKIEDHGLKCLDKPGETIPACKRYKNECSEVKNYCKRPRTGCTKFGTKQDCSTQVNASLIGCATIGIFGSCGINKKCDVVTDPGVCLEYGVVGCDDWGNYCSQTHQSCEPGFDEPLCKKQVTDLRITKYFSAPAAVNTRIINAPMGNSDQDVLSGLTLRFKWPDGKTIDCLPLQLLTDVQGQSIRFKMQNNATCKPFPEGYTDGSHGSPVLSVVNRISTQRLDVSCGIMDFSSIEGTKYYGCLGYNALELTPDQRVAGQVPMPQRYSTSPLTLSYYPVVDLNAVLISRSGAFTSDQSKEEQAD